MSRRRTPQPMPAETNALLALLHAGQWGRLESAARAMLARHPGHPFPWQALGLALQGKGALAEAADALGRAARLVPGDADAQGLLGGVLHHLGRHAGAEACYRRVLAIQPNHADTYNNLGNVLKDMGRHAEAEASYRKALTILPEHADVHCNLGNLLRERDRLAEAEACFHRALEIRPDHLDAHSGLGNVFHDLGSLEEAADCYRRALEIDPGHAGAHNNLGFALQHLGRFAESEAGFRRALAIDPGYADARSNLLLGLTYRADPPEAYRAEALEYGRTVAALVRARYPAWNCAAAPERLRVGIVSGDLRRHPVGYFLEGVLTHLDPARIELIAYPTFAKNDDMTARLRSCFTAWRPLVGLDDETAARQIHEDGVHVLLDLSGHTAHNRLPLFSWKPAPVQVSWLGYWATTGVAEMDWLLADESGVPPEHQQHFTEKIWCLPETRLCFTPPDTDLPVAMLPALERGFVTFGSFQVQAKINDEVLRVWSRVLASCPGSRLRMQEKTLSDPDIAEALRKRMAAQGIVPERVDLRGAMPRREYLAAYAEVDILLDTFPFSGGTTTCEALWMGVPTLTLAGETLIARQGASLLTAAGLPDWIATDDDEYVAKAVTFASDLNRLAGLRAGLREQVLASPLFDAPRFARNLEDALWGMWQQSGHCDISQLS